MAAVGLLVGGGGGASWVLIPGVSALCFCSVGLVVRLRVPDNRIGWLFVFSGFALAVGLLFDAYGFAARPLGFSGQVAAAVVANQFELAAFYALPGLILVFPEGRLPSRRWRPLAGLWTAGVALVVLGTILQPGGMISLAHDSLENPLALRGGLGAFVRDAVAKGSLILIIGGVVVATGSQARRYRRSSGDLRQQLKWFGSAAAMFALVLGGVGLLKHFEGGKVAWQVLTLALPAALTGVIVATGIAILRYRLYGIDLIIRRTLVYTALIGVLGVVYLGGIYVIERALQSGTGQSGAFAVTLSTLAVAAGFQPLRTRIQRAVNHRFYRGAYDTAKTLGAFTDRLRSQIGLDEISADVLNVVATQAYGSVPARQPCVILRPRAGNARPTPRPGASQPRSGSLPSARGAARTGRSRSARSTGD